MSGGKLRNALAIEWNLGICTVLAIEWNMGMCIVPVVEWNMGLCTVLTVEWNMGMRTVPVVEWNMGMCTVPSEGFLFLGGTVGAAAMGRGGGGVGGWKLRGTAYPPWKRRVEGAMVLERDSLLPEGEVQAGGISRVSTLS